MPRPKKKTSNPQRSMQQLLNKATEAFQFPLRRQTTQKRLRGIRFILVVMRRVGMIVLVKDSLTG